MPDPDAVVPPHFRSVAHAGTQPGARLIVLGAVHGNETCGTRAIERVLGELDGGALAIRRGTATFVPVTNPLAHARGQRTGDRNLNRNLAPTSTPRDFEDHVANWLCPLLRGHEVLLDLHSTRAKNEAFAMLGPRDNTGTLQPFARAGAERALALRLGVRRFVDGWLETYARGVERRVARAKQAGTAANALNTDSRYGVGTTEYMRSAGGYAITLECGQHEDPEAPHVAYRAIRNALAFLGLVDAPAPEPVPDPESLSLHEVIDRHDPGDAFAKEWSSFNRLHAGELIATRRDGSRLTAPSDGYIVFPDHKAEPGNEWYYLAQASPGP